MFSDYLELKSAADAAFKEGRLEDAEVLYDELISLDPTSIAALTNHSAVALKCGQPQRALDSAERALQLLSAQAASGHQSCVQQLAKAFHRKAQALMGLGATVQGLRVYRQGLATCPGAQEELLAALRLTTDNLPPSWLAKYWGRLLEEAQVPNPLSSRDGRLLKAIPPERRMAAEEVQSQLEEALRGGLHDEARDLMCTAWAEGRKPGKAEAAFFRAAAYHQAGAHEQALKDVRVALVYGPQLLVYPQGPGDAAGNSKALALRTKGRGGGGKAGAGGQEESGPPPPRQVPCWPAALALQSSIQEALADNVAAALSACKALELDPGNAGYEAALERLLRRIPEEQARALQEGGSAGLEAFLAAEREQRLPEFLRKRPKYYYYYEWMRKRINQQYPELPEPVMDKLLTMEANELDLILQYPQATQQTVEHVLGVYQEHGEEYLETYRVPLLSWEEVKALKGPDTIGLALGDEAFGGMLHALSGSESSTNKPTPPALPPSGAAPALPAAGAAGGGVQQAQQAGAAAGEASPGSLLSHRTEEAFSDEDRDGSASQGSASVQDEGEEDQELEDEEEADFSDLYQLD